MNGMELLRQKIDDSGYKLKFVAQQCGLTYVGFLNKMKGNTQFLASEIKVLTELLHLTTDEVTTIFFS